MKKVVFSVIFNEYNKCLLYLDDMTQAYKTINVNFNYSIYLSDIGLYRIEVNVYE